MLVAAVASQIVAPVMWDHYAMVLFLPMAWLLERRQFWALVVGVAFNATFILWVPPIAYVVFMDVMMVAVAYVGTPSRDRRRAFSFAIARLIDDPRTPAALLRPALGRARPRAARRCSRCWSRCPRWTSPTRSARATRSSASGALPGVDTWTFTVAGTPWLDQQWLAQVLLSLFHGIGGWELLAVVRAGLVVLALGLLLAAMVELGVKVRIAAILVLVAFLLAAPALALRPQLFAIAIFCAFLWMVTTRWWHPTLYLFMPVLVILWANVHGSFVLVPLILGYALLDDIACSRGWRRSAIELVVGTAATLINPFGIGVVDVCREHRHRPGHPRHGQRVAAHLAAHGAGAPVLRVAGRHARVHGGPVAPQGARPRVATGCGSAGSPSSRSGRSGASRGGRSRPPTRWPRSSAGSRLHASSGSARARAG